jgi:serine/threonine protein kinase/Flp pilus assembly protein TadD
MDSAGETSEARIAEDLTGATVGRYVVSAPLGAGAMGEVYLAQHTQLHNHVAIKRLAPKLRSDAQFRQRFLREGQRASALNHPHIARVYDVLEEKSELLLVMEHVEGSTLRQRLKEGPLSAAEFLDAAIQCSEALSVAHQKGILHGDIKPENIMLTPEHQVKVLDFGVARCLPIFDEDAETRSVQADVGTIAGTPAYMAPEVLLLKPSDARADLFSLGVVFYEMLSGRHPFLAGGFTATTDRILHEDPPPLSRIDPDISEALSHVVAKALAKDLTARYPSAQELVADLRGLQRGERPALGFPYKVLGIGLTLVMALILTRVPSVQQRVKNWLSRSASGGQLQAAVPHEKNLAVLPFTVVGGDSTLAAFGTGLAATLNGKLTQLTEDRSLQVIPASEMREKDVVTLEQARQEFGVNLGLRITLDRSAEMIRITYSLIDAKTRRQLRGKTITEPMSDIFAIEDSVAESVVNSLQIELQPQERQVLDFHGTTQPAAYDYYLQGRGYLGEAQKPENVESAIRVLNQALNLDKNYTLAYAGLGEAYWRKWESAKQKEWVTQATQACTKAVQLDENQAQGHYCLGLVHSGKGQYESAISQFRRAVEIEPTNDAAYVGLGFCYESLNMFSEAEKTYQSAIGLRPHYWAGYNWLGAFYERRGRYAEAAQVFSQVVKLAPDSFVGYNNLGGLDFAQGRYQDAITMFERSVAIRPTADALSNLATAYFYERLFDNAARTYERAAKLDARSYDVWGNLGDAYWFSGDRNRAVEAYRTAITLAEDVLKVNPHRPTTIGYVALYRAMLGDKKEALDYLRRALQLAPDVPELRFTAALVYNQLGDRKGTLSWLEKSLQAGYSANIVLDAPAFDELKTDPKFRALSKNGKRE